MQMTTVIKVGVVCHAILFLSGCGRYELATSEKYMTVDECYSSDFCTFRGRPVAKYGEYGKVVEIFTSDGKCINASFPEKKWNALRKNPKNSMTIQGNVFTEPEAEGPESVIIEINGRRIGLGRCGNKFVFVE
jgi:hypothetical protein